MSRLKDEKLAVHVVWMPVLAGDDREAAEQSKGLIPDPRARHYWTDEQSLGMAYGKILKLPRGRDLAWDIYFAFDAGVKWEEAPPVPADWAHRLGSDDRFLADGSTFRDTIESLLK